MSFFGINLKKLKIKNGGRLSLLIFNFFFVITFYVINFWLGLLVLIL